MSNIVAHLKFGSCCKKNNIVYFYNMSFNAVFYLDIKDFSIHFLHRFSHEPIEAEKLSINGSFIYENAIYFLPNNTHLNAIMKYDLKERQEQLILISDCNEKRFRTAGFVQFGRLVYLFPNDLKKGIYIFDLQRQKVEKDNELSLLFTKGFVCGNVCKTSDDCILLNMGKSNKLIKIDLGKKKIVGSWIIGDDIQIYSMHFDGQNYWFLQTQSMDIYEWNCESNILQRYVNNETKQNEQKSVPYANMIFLETEILVLSYSMKSVLRINNEKKVVEKYIVFPRELQLVNKKYVNWPICFKYDILDEQVLLYPIQGNMLLIYDKKNHQISGKPMRVSEKEIPFLKDILKNIMLEKELCIENDELETLEKYIEIIEKKEEVSPVIGSENIGQLIYQQENL